jgi:uncharacterized repeat protein (TIGR03803 family)
MLSEHTRSVAPSIPTSHPMPKGQKVCTAVSKFNRSTFTRAISANFDSRTDLFLKIIFTILLATVCATAQTVTTIHDFGSGQDGDNPQSGVIFDSKGNLFGTAALGGSNGDGTAYELAPPVGGQGQWTETILHQFAGQPDGDTPDSVLTMAFNGRLFGTTQLGGSKNLGSVFALLPPRLTGDPWRERVLYSFGSVPNDGTGPNMGVLAKSGSLLGVTVDGGANRRGTVFQLTPSPDPAAPWSETILYSFAASPDGNFPSSDLIMDGSGNLYGVTLLGGAHNLGAVYRLSPPTLQGGPWTETVLFSFSGPDGSSPFGRLLLDKSGALYGTTSGGGPSQAGTVFMLTPQSGEVWTEQVLYSFSGGADGGSPEAGVIMDQKGRLFGTASTGGTGRLSGGVVFRLDAPTQVGGAWTETVLYSFGGSDGFRPLSRLVPRNGALYGTTSAGGLNGTGTVFQLMP